MGEPFQQIGAFVADGKNGEYFQTLTTPF
jgi:hypothetical protein